MEKQKSLKLLKFYYDVEKVISQLDGTFLNLLKTSEGDVLANIKRRIERIEKREYVVLVAGKCNLILDLTELQMYMHYNFENHAGTIQQNFYTCNLQVQLLFSTSETIAVLVNVLLN